MKPGSIVVIKPIRAGIADHLKPFIKWLPEDNEKTEYMVREVIEIGVTLEEGVIGLFLGQELCIDLQYVKEVLPADNINVEELLELQLV